MENPDICLVFCRWCGFELYLHPCILYGVNCDICGSYNSNNQDGLPVGSPTTIKIPSHQFQCYARVKYLQLVQKVLTHFYPKERYPLYGLCAGDPYYGYGMVYRSKIDDSNITSTSVAAARVNVDSSHIHALIMKYNFEKWKEEQGLSNNQQGLIDKMENMNMNPAN